MLETTSTPALPPDMELQALAKTRRRLRGYAWLLQLAVLFSAMAVERIVSDTSWDVSPRNFIVMAAIAALFWIAFIVSLIRIRARILVVTPDEQGVAVSPRAMVTAERKGRASMERRATKHTDAEPFETARIAGLSLPHVQTTSKYDGSPVLKLRGCFMAGLATHPSAEPGTLVIKGDFEDREWLLAEAPETFFRPSPPALVAV